MLFAKKLTKFFGLAALMAALVIPAFAAHHEEEGFTKIFDGESLAGWTIQGLEKAGPKIEDGVLVVGGWDYWAVISEKTYGDFILKFDVKFDPKGNSGLLIHSDKKEVFENAFEIQLAAKGEDHITGTIFTEEGALNAPEEDATKEVGEWNSVEVHYDTPKLTLKINGEVVYEGLDVSQFEDVETVEEGHIAFQRNDYKKAAYFKNIRIKEMD